MQAVRRTYSTNEGGQCRQREAERGLYLTVLPCKENIKEETLTIHRGGITNGNEIRENIPTVAGESRHGIHINRASDK